MIGADRIAPGDQVMSLAGPDEGRANSDRRLAFVRFDVVDLGDVMLGHAVFQHVDRFEVDRRKRLEILRSNLATFFETWRTRHAPNLIQRGLNVQPGLGLGCWQGHRDCGSRFARGDLYAARMCAHDVLRDRQAQATAG